MAEPVDEPGAESSGSAQAGPDGGVAATALALIGMRRGKSPDKLDAFLDKQGRLIDLQTEHLHEQRAVMLSRQRLGRWKDRMSLGLQVMTAVVGLVVVIAIAVMAWQAHEDHGLVIEAFSVPPDLAQRGLTGQVAAARMLDRLSELQAQTISARPASTYADSWGDDIKVEIPETGVSIGELNRYLRQWLGHETRISGEMVRTATGLSVTARAGAGAGKTFDGPDADVNTLISQAAEAIYGATQPYRYAVYLASHGRDDEAKAAYARLARSGAPDDRPWAYAGWSAMLFQRGDHEGAVAVVREGMRRGLPLFETGALSNLIGLEQQLGHMQAMLDAQRLSLREAQQSGRGNALVSGDAILRMIQAGIAENLGDARSAAVGYGEVSNFGAEGLAVIPLGQLEVLQLIKDHDVSGGLRRLGQTSASDYLSEMFAAQQVEDWPRFVALAEQERSVAQAAGPVERDNLERRFAPLLALGYARTGRQAEADALVAGTALDCEPCLDVRAQTAAAKQDWAGADRWFAALDRQAPDIPLWDTDWGQALLAKGDVDGAIAKLQQAHRKGPHFADPLEIWGEALMKKGDLVGAVRKFHEADTYAPRWGRNHLRWGQALTRLGKAGEAKAQWRAAAGMDLSVTDRAELNRMQGHG